LEVTAVAVVAAVVAVVEQLEMVLLEVGQLEVQVGQDLLQRLMELQQYMEPEEMAPPEVQLLLEHLAQQIPARAVVVVVVLAALLVPAEKVDQV
jgi:hypothetical protein